MRALKAEIESQSTKYTDYTVQTIFFGGGTPTAVEAATLCEVLQVLKKHFNIAIDAEISMEANPGTVTAEALVQYKEAGINRLSIGLQSANDEELKLLGRIHTYADFLETYRLAVETGFTNINVDLMSALPGQTVQGYEETLQKILALDPPPRHISAYSLIIEEGTPFYEVYSAEREEMDRTGEIRSVSVNDKKPHLPSEEAERLMYESTARILAKAGYERYEISNYSQPGYECRHNTVYWRRGDYVGFGLGAASLVNNVRFRNTDSLQDYLKFFEYVADDRNGTETEPKDICINVELREGIIGEQEILSVEEQMEEFMFLGLRMTNGISKEEFRETFGVSLEDIFGEVIRKNIKEGLLEEITSEKAQKEIADKRMQGAQLQQSGDRIALTKRGLDVSNYVMAQFML